MREYSALEVSKIKNRIHNAIFKLQSSNLNSKITSEKVFPNNNKVKE